MFLTETIILCAVFFILCILGTGTDDKNLKHYMSYPDEVQKRIRQIKEYQGRFKETSILAIWMANFLLFAVLFFALGIFIRTENFMHNFTVLFIAGQTINVFDLIVIDLLWWRNTKRIRFSKIPQKQLYQNPKKHVEAFIRAFLMYFVVALLDGYLLAFILINNYM
uniref:ABC transporter permease n=1 Tax=Ndongobacter massiliensis TaxID=1871025 RepID=UPI0009311D72|nr:ABC transporter permease [Ndongobacter massiliensis]